MRRSSLIECSSISRSLQLDAWSSVPLKSKRVDELSRRLVDRVADLLGVDLGDDVEARPCPPFYRRTVRWRSDRRAGRRLLTRVADPYCCEAQRSWLGSDRECGMGGEARGAWRAARSASSTTARRC